MWNNDISACLHNERIVKMLDVDNSQRKKWPQLQT